MVRLFPALFGFYNGQFNNGLNFLAMELASWPVVDICMDPERLSDFIDLLAFVWAFFPYREDASCGD